MGALVPAFLIGQTLAVARLIRKVNPAAIHAHWIVPGGVCARLGRVLSGRHTPILLTSHGADLFTLRGMITSRIKRWAIEGAAASTVVSEAMRQKLADLNPESIVYVRSMGVDYEHTFRCDKSEERRNSCRIIFAGRLVEKKGVKHLIHAFRLISASNPDLELVIIGDGPERVSLERLTSDLSLGNRIRFLGERPQSFIAEAFCSATIAVFPFVIASDGDQEGLGLVVPEAMGCGCAVIAGDVPAVHDSIEDGVSGYLVNSANERYLAERIGKLVCDPDERRSLAETASARARARFGWPAVANHYRDILDSVLIPAPAPNKSGSI